MTIDQKTAYGTILSRGDGGLPAAVASVLTTDSAGDAEIVWTAQTPGVAGDSITIELDAAGTNAATSVGVISNAITVTVRSSAGTPLADANEIISEIQESAAASALVDVTNGTGNGSGVITDQGPTNLAGGADGTEVFTEIEGVRNLVGPNLQTETVDATHHASVSSYRETRPTFLSGGEVSFDLLLDTTNAQHVGLETDFTTRTLTASAAASSVPTAARRKRR